MRRSGGLDIHKLMTEVEDEDADINARLCATVDRWDRCRFKDWHPVDVSDRRLAALPVLEKQCMVRYLERTMEEKTRKGELQETTP